ncbi:MAG: ATP-binding protein [Clostridia bacterium]|nr:ATP-binding protein [Clostridia bacterium]
MKELSLNILDIAQNSIKAGASLVEIGIEERGSSIEICVTDNGCGMSEEFLRTVTDPFSTSRTTRKVGMGLPLLKLAAEQTGGELEIFSKVGEGTKVKATFNKDHIDCAPLGDVIGTVITLIQGSPDIDFDFSHRTDKGEAALDTRLMRKILGDEVPLNEPSVLEWAKESLEDEYYNMR